MLYEVITRFPAAHPSSASAALTKPNAGDIHPGQLRDVRVVNPKMQGLFLQPGALAFGACTDDHEFFKPFLDEVV